MVATTLEFPTTETGYDHAVVDLRRVSRTVKGGRRFRFRAAVVIGDRKGRVGFAVRKGKDAQGAVASAEAAARRHLQAVPSRGTTIPHAVRARYGGAEVLLKPAPSGTGLIAGTVVRAVASLAGITDLSGKLFGSRNKLNAARATFAAFSQLKAGSSAGPAAPAIP